jgi:hypothetical protein
MQIIGVALTLLCFAGGLFIPLSQAQGLASMGEVPR